MVDAVWKRWALAGVLAVMLALVITAILSRPSQQTKERRSDAFGAWKTHTGVDLTALPRKYPPRPDTAAARGLDAILAPAGLHLGHRSSRPDGLRVAKQDEAGFHDLRNALRAEIRFEAAEMKPFPPTVVSLLERSAPVLDAVAEYVGSHDDIVWYEDFGPRPRHSSLVLDDHLSLHRLLIGRAYLALERDDAETASRMLTTSRRLNRLLIERHERSSQFTAAGIERLQLALLRRGGDRLGRELDEPRHALRERFVTAMSAEAALILANSSSNPFTASDEPPEVAVRIIAGGSLELAASDAVARVARHVEEVVAASDPCAELKKERRPGSGFFSGDFYTLNATEAWRRFVVLSLDRAMTNAALTGRAESPCGSVTITVRDDGTTRTVEASGLPSSSPNVINLPEKISVPSRR